MSRILACLREETMSLRHTCLQNYSVERDCNTAILTGITTCLSTPLYSLWLEYRMPLVYSFNPKQ